MEHTTFILRLFVYKSIRCQTHDGNENVISASSYVSVEEHEFHIERITSIS